jgi:hypothetical protein
VNRAVIARFAFVVWAFMVPPMSFHHLNDEEACRVPPQRIAMAALGVETPLSSNDAMATQ